MKLSFLCVVLLNCCSSIAAFDVPGKSCRHQEAHILHASGQGFGKSQGGDKTYGDAATASPIKDLIDTEAAMENFFSAREEWKPLFRAITTDSACQAMQYLADDSGDSTTIDFHESSTPWRRLKEIPEKDSEKEVIGNFLDEVQKSLLEIPTDEKTKEDENDLQFIEEGRRMLTISRFHVLGDNQAGSGIESYDELFSTCWSELYELSSTGNEHTASLIVLPEYDLQDLRRFVDMNLQRPLDWLGLSGDFEIASMQRGSPAVRLIYKIKDIPELDDEVEQGLEEAE